ncbi:MAG: hypothetical protein LBK43_01385 [Treponema sp.]|jgi:hypothetical protein|nr:hypothetical protein [Treponema sp.]
MTITAGREALKQALYIHRKELGRAGRNRKHRPQSWLYPWATEKHYAAAIRAWLRPMMDYVHTYLKNNEEAILRGDSAALVRQDAIPGGSYRRLVKSLNGWFTTYLPEINENGTRDAPPVVFMGLGNIAENLNDFNDAQWQKAAKAELGVEFPMYEEWWEPTKQTWQEENYRLIRKLSDDYIGQINQKTEQAVISGWSVSQLAAEIRKIDGSIKQGRANLIARDQIGKLNEMATQARMEQAGLTMYIWSTAQDERVRGYEGGHYPNARPSHHLMEGLLCRWSDPAVCSDDKGKTWKPRPSDAVLLHPGRDIQCRCAALSYWEELVGEVDSVIAKEEGYDAPERAAPTPHQTPPSDEIAEKRIKELVRKITTEQEAIELGGLLLNKAGKEKRDIFSVMGEYRKFGTTQKHTFDAGSYGKKRIEAASQYYPRNWVELSIKDAKANGLKVKRVSRGYYSHYQREIALDIRFGCELHEMAHRMEALNPQIVSLEKEFYNRRTQGEALVRLKMLPGYDNAEANERVRVDKFASPYMGKDYGGDAYELLSMGLENLKTKKYNTDVDYDSFIVGVLTGVK